MLSDADLDALREQLIMHEGLRLRPYRCTAGKLTLGIGRNIEDVGISKDEAMLLLRNDIEAAETSLAMAFPWFDNLNAVRQRALIDLRFNMGLGRLKTFRKALAAMATARWGDAALELLNSAWAKQVQPSRRDRIVRMIQTGADPATTSGKS